jgi:hypothetical protein
METKVKEKEIPEIAKRRIKLSNLFYPLERKYQRRWAKVFNQGFEQTADKLKELSLELQYDYKIPEANSVLWIDSHTNRTECMFCLINDSMDFDMVFNIFKEIEKYEPFFTYAFVHQKKEGVGIFDIFRFSKFSYLEHCNRVKYP